jgi:hypothetical protein
MEIEDDVEFEPNRLRKDYRIKLPARAKMKGTEYKVINWSFAGFAVTDLYNGNSEKVLDETEIGRLWNLCCHLPPNNMTFRAC